MSAHDDLLLHVISARGEMSWQSFRKAFDALHARATQSESDVDVSLLRARSLRVFDWLGHCDVSGQGSAERIYAAPPMLARLPVAGAGKAVLCGARSPRAGEELAEVCRRLGCRLRVESQSRGAEGRYVPCRIGIEAESPEALAAAAREAGVACPEAPPAGGLAEFSGTLHEYLLSRPPLRAPELDWPRRDYDVGALQFCPEGGEKVPRLCAYDNPHRPERLHRLWQGGAYREVERDWGRYAMLRVAGVDVLSYDPRRFVLLVPAGAPLPRLLARACVLCSGYAPAFVRPPAYPGAPAERAGYHLFRAVPPAIAQTVATKLSQKLSFAQLGALAPEESHD